MADKRQLYYAALEDTKQLLLLGGKFALIYDDMETAEKATKSLSKKYQDKVIKVEPVLDNDSFFNQLASDGINEFLLNGDSRILSADDFKDGTVPTSGTSGKSSSSENIDNPQPIMVTPYIPPTATRSYSHKESKKTSSVFATIFSIALLLIMIVSTLNPDAPTKKSKNKKLSKEEMDDIIAAVELGNRTYGVDAPRSASDIVNDLMETSPYAVDDFDVEKYLEKFLENSPYFGKKLPTYTSDAEYKKGTITNGIFKSEHIALQGELKQGLSWMSEEEQSLLLANEVYQLDWECCVKSNTSPDRFTGMFTLPIDEAADFDKCLDILKKINTTYWVESTSGTIQFLDIQLPEGESDFDQATLNKYRKYRHAVFINDSTVEREFYYNKVNDRLVCIVSQYNIASPDEILVDFIEKKED